MKLKPSVHVLLIHIHSYIGWFTYNNLLLLFAAQKMDITTRLAIKTERSVSIIPYYKIYAVKILIIFSTIIYYIIILLLCITLYRIILIVRNIIHLIIIITQKLLFIKYYNNIVVIICLYLTILDRRGGI